MFEFLQAGGPFMWLLLIMSITSVTYIIERSLSLRWSQIIPQPISDALDHCRDEDDVEHFYTLCQQHDSPIGRLLAQAMKHFSYSRAENVEMLQTRARKEIAGLEQGLVIIEVIVGSAPLLGLVGTLHGLITLFGDFGSASMADHSALAKGISIALNTTLTGLLIAIPSLIAWSYFNKKVENLSIEMESICEAFLQRFYPPIADQTIEHSATDGKTARARKERRKSD